MKKLFLFTNLFILCLVMGFSAHATDVGGLILEDTTWTKAGSPYVVISNVTVIEDVTLTIKPGVEVKFNQGKALLIDGTLVARGTSSEKIAFTSNGEQKAGYWGYIFFSDSSTDATFDPDYTGGCILQYTTIQYGGSGASVIKIDRSSPFIDNSTISQNTGSGIYIAIGAPVISNSTISGNAATGLIGYGTPKGGGGIYAASSTITVSNSTISSNSVSAFASDTSAMSAGGGIYAISSTIIVNNSAISRNSVSSTAAGGYGCYAYSYGGGIYATSSTVTVNNSTISENTASASGYHSYPYGGGVYAESGTTVTVSNSTISGNSVSGEYYNGGGVYATSSTVTVSNSTISGNSANNGGGVCAYSGTVKVSSSTFSSNIANSGGAIYVSGTDFTMKGNIITENTASAQYGGVVRLDSLKPGSVIGGGSCEDANVIKDNNGDGVWIKGNPDFNHNDVYYTDGFYSLVCGNAAGAPDIDATNNYWGTDKESVVKAVIWDGLDDPALGLVNYNPFLTEPCKPEPTHTVTITNGPTAVPDTLPSSGGDVNLSVTAEDSLGHAINYSWTVSPDEGSFDDANKQNPIWTAPANLTGSDKTYTLTVTAFCSIEPSIKDTGSVQVIVKGEEPALCVWPGDTNNNGKVDQADVLPLGLHWARTGPARPGGSFIWECQSAEAWGPEAATFADASGDGIVNQADVLPIGVNWGLTHDASSLATFFLPQPIGEVQPSVIKPIVIPRPYKNQFTVGIKVGQVSNLFGIAFALKYAHPNAIKPLSVEAGDFLGSDVIFYSNVDDSEGTICIGISRKRPQSGVSGSGIVTQITFQSDLKLPAVRMTIREVTAIDADGRIIPFGGAQNAPDNGEWLVSLQQMPLAPKLAQNFPNPFNPETWIPFQLKESADVTISIYDASGKVVRIMNLGEKPAGFYTSKETAAYWDGRNADGEMVASGVYFYAIRAGKFFAQKKMIVVR